MSAESAAALQEGLALAHWTITDLWVASVGMGGSFARSDVEHITDGTRDATRPNTASSPPPSTTTSPTKDSTTPSTTGTTSDQTPTPPDPPAGRRRAITRILTRPLPAHHAVPAPGEKRFRLPAR